MARTLLPSSPFLLTRPLRDVTMYNVHHLPKFDISTHTPLAGRDDVVQIDDMETLISTHTPLAGRDI